MIEKYFKKQVRLLDHDWIVTEKHEIIPSVYALIVIEAGELGRPDAVTYSGPTYISLRSGKHSSSTALNHALDSERLLQIEVSKKIVMKKLKTLNLLYSYPLTVAWMRIHDI